MPAKPYSPNCGSLVQQLAAPGLLAIALVLFCLRVLCFLEPPKHRKKDPPLTKSPAISQCPFLRTSQTPDLSGLCGDIFSFVPFTMWSNLLLCPRQTSPDSERKPSIEPVQSRSCNPHLFLPGTARTTLHLPESVLIPGPV